MLLCLASAVSLFAADWQQWQGAGQSGLPRWSSAIGYASDGSPLYFARAAQNGQIVLGMVSSIDGSATMFGPAGPAASVQIYYGGGNWVLFKNTQFPAGAIVTGNEADGSPLIQCAPRLTRGRHSASAYTPVAQRRAYSSCHLRGLSHNTGN